MRVSDIHDLERSAADRKIREQQELINTLMDKIELAGKQIRNLEQILTVREIEKATANVRLSSEATLNTMLAKAIDEALETESMAPLKKAKVALVEFRSFWCAAEGLAKR